MNINSMNTFYPPQPNNPSDQERFFLSQYALVQLNRSEDFQYIKDLMSPPMNITMIAHPGEFKGQKVGVIGGGLAGMAAAFELRKLGFDITIFDALEDRIGGRVYTYYLDETRTLYGEFGPMRIPVNHETTWHYINLFCLDTRTFIQANNNGLIFLRGARSRSHSEYVKKTIYPKYKLSVWEKNISWRQLISYGYNSHLFCANALQRAEILQVKPNYNPNTLYWDYMNSRQMLEVANLSNDAISLVSCLSPISGNFLYNSYIDYIQEEYPPDFSFLYELIGGSAKLPHAFYNSFTNDFSESRFYNISKRFLGKTTWKGGNWVTGIYRNSDSGKISLSFSNKMAHKSLFEEFDYIICAIPFSTLRNLEIKPSFSPVKMQAIKEVNYGNAQKSLLHCNHRFWEDIGIYGGPSYTDLPITSIWYPSDFVQYNTTRNRNITNDKQIVKSQKNLHSSQPGVIMVYNFNLDAIRLESIPDEMRFREIKREIEMVHGLRSEYLNDIVVNMKTVNWNTEKWFRGAFCYLTPEQKRLFSFAMSTPEYKNRVFFAGEHISAKHRWMQGALQSGMYAANDLARACRLNKNK